MKNLKLLSSSIFILLFSTSLFAQRNSNIYPDENTYYSIQIANKFVTVMGAAKGETNVGLSSSAKGDAQLFRFIPQKNSAYYLIETKLKKGIYLTVDYSRTKPNTNIKLNPRKNNNQYFRFMDAGNGLLIYSKLSSNVFLGANTNKDNLVIQGHSNRGLFAFSKSGASSNSKANESSADNTSTGNSSGSTASINTNKVYNIQVKKSGKNLDVAAGSKKDRAKILQYQKTGGANQAFQFKDEGGGYYSIKAVHSNKALDVSTKSKGSAVYQYAYHGKANQLFKLESKGNGYYVIRSKSANTVLDVKANGELTHWNLHGGANQLFKLAETKVPAQTIMVYDEKGIGVLSYKYKDADYTFSAECSVPDWLKDPSTKKFKDIFYPACETHDRNYRAPWRTAGFAGYAGKEIADERFHEDMEDICDKRYASNFVEKGYCYTAAQTWFTAVNVTSQGKSAFDSGQTESTTIVDKNSISKGGFISVYSDAGYVTEVKVSYVVNGKRIHKSGKVTALDTEEIGIPLGATNIKLNVEGLGCGLSFSKSFAKPVAKCYKVWGTIFDTEWRELSGCK